MFALLCLFSFFSTKPRDWRGRTFPKRPILCRVGRKTTTQSIIVKAPKVQLPLADNTTTLLKKRKYNAFFPRVIEGAAAGVIVDEQIGCFLLTEVLNRISPEQIAHRSG